MSSPLVRSLTIGDREALLLHLHRLTLGEELLCVLNCRNPDCRARLDLDLRVSDLLLPPYPQPQPWHGITLEDGDAAYTFQVRLPTGGDQEAVAGLAVQDQPAAVGALWQRLIEGVTCNSETCLDWPPALQPTLSLALSNLDPQAELQLNVICPECGHQFFALLDMAQFFTRELAHRIKHLYREVHLLAWYYHWSEAEIMGMTYRNRHVYLDLLDEAISAGHNR